MKLKESVLRSMGVSIRESVETDRVSQDIYKIHQRVFDYDSDFISQKEAITYITRLLNKINRVLPTLPVRDVDTIKQDLQDLDDLLDTYHLNNGIHVNITKGPNLNHVLSDEEWENEYWDPEYDECNLKEGSDTQFHIGDEVIYNFDHYIITQISNDGSCVLKNLDNMNDPYIGIPSYNLSRSPMTIEVPDELYDEFFSEIETDEDYEECNSRSMSEDIKWHVYYKNGNKVPRNGLPHKIVTAPDEESAKEEFYKSAGRNAGQYGIVKIYRVEEKCNMNEASYDEDPETSDQEYSSATTSINSSKLPAIYNLVKFSEGDVVLDYGGGRFDNGVEYLDSLGCTGVVYDPYNRSQSENSHALEVVRKNRGADKVLCSNVLNVIKEPAARSSVIKNCKRYLKSGGTAYFTVYEGTGNGNEGPTKSGYQLNRKTADYVEEISQIFSSVVRKGKLIICN